MKDKHDDKIQDMFASYGIAWDWADMGVDTEYLRKDLQETFKYFESLSEKELNPYLFGEWKQEDK